MKKCNGVSINGTKTNCENPSMELIFHKNQTYCTHCKKRLNIVKNPITNSTEKRIENCMSQYPAPGKAIYGLMEKISKQIHYIGESIGTSRRLYEHFNREDKNTSSSISHLTAEERHAQYDYCIIWDGTDFSKQERLMREMVLIQALKPKYNKQWNQEED